MNLYPVYTEKFERDRMHLVLMTIVLLIGLYAMWSAVAYQAHTTEIVRVDTQLEFVRKDVTYPAKYVFLGVAGYILLWGVSLWFRSKAVWWWGMINLGLATLYLMFVGGLLLVMPMLQQWSSPPGALRTGVPEAVMWASIVPFGIAMLCVLVCIWWWRRRIMYGFGRGDGA